MAVTAEPKSKPAAANQESVTLHDNATGKQIELPLLSPTLGNKVVDIRKLHAGLDYFTFDPGYTATGSCPTM